MITAERRYQACREKISSLQDEGKSVVLVSIDGKPSGIIAFMDEPRQSSIDAIRMLKSMGVDVVMLTGDNRRSADAVARALGIEHVLAEVMPDGKIDAIRMIQAKGKGEGKGKRVAMVGDGINDAPALMQADVGIAMGNGTDIAIEAGDVILVRDDPMEVATAVELSRKVMSKIRQNLIYAFMYNVALIPVAALGLLYPALAGLAMAASSVSVTMSSLLMRRWMPKSRRR